MTVAELTAKPTRERILDAALRLFAEQGYEATTIGEIEAAAGLAARSGALYKHFASKRALVEAGFAERYAALDSLDARLDLLPLGDLRAELRLVARIALDDLWRQGDLCRLVMKEGHRFPEIADAFRKGIVERGHRIAAVWIGARNDGLAEPLPDPEATAQVLTDALVGYAVQHHMFGERLTTIARERVVEAWVRLAADHLGPAEPEGS